MKQLALAIPLALAACRSTPDHRLQAQAEIRGELAAWIAAAEAKDAQRFATYYADDAVLMLEGVPDFDGAEAIRGAIAHLMGDPRFSLTIVPMRVEASRSGDLAYELGTYSMTTSGADEKPATQVGRYVVVWRKAADGAWKVVVDAPLSDPHGSNR